MKNATIKQSSRGNSVYLTCEGWDGEPIGYIWIGNGSSRDGGSFLGTIEGAGIEKLRAMLDTHFPRKPSKKPAKPKARKP